MDIPQLEREVIDTEDCLAELDAMEARAKSKAELILKLNGDIDTLIAKLLLSEQKTILMGNHIDEMEAENKRYREALEFYAQCEDDCVSYEMRIGGDINGRLIIGKIARVALKGGE